MLRCKKIKIAVCLFLAVCLCLSLAGLAGAQPSDIGGHWAQSQIADWIIRGLAAGYPDGTYKPDNNITRAEFMALANKAFTFTSQAVISYPDVKVTDWFAGDVSRGKAAGYISGYPDGTIKPNTPISRQEAASIIAGILKLDATSSSAALSRLQDNGDIPGWSRSAIGAIVAAGLMSGYPDQTFRPLDSIKRAEAVVALDNALKAFQARTTTISYDQPGTYGPGQGTATVDGTVYINVAGVTLQNTVITGDLVLAEGISSGNATLNNIVVKGKTVVRGGGSHSVTLNNCTLPSLTVSKDGVRIVASGSTSVTLVRLDSGATLVETNTTGPGFETVTMSSVIPPGAQIMLTGNFDAVSVETGNAHVAISGGTIAKLDVAAGATGTGIDIASGATIGTLTLNAVVNVTGQGTVNNAYNIVSGSTIANTVTVGSSTTGNSGSTVQAITVSNIAAANTVGKVRFDTGTVITASDLDGKVFADGVALTTIEQRGTGTPGEVWSGMIPSPVQDHNYTITFSSPFVISGSNTVSWPSQAAAPAVTGVGVNLNTSSPSGNGSDITVSFTEPSGANTKISTYRVLVVRTNNTSSFDLTTANAASNYSAVNKGLGTITLNSGTNDTSGTIITTGVSYEIFVLSICDGTNATVNGLSLPSSSFTLSGGGGGGGGLTSITTSNIMATNTFGKIKFDTDTTTTATDLAGKILADGVALTGFAARNSDTTGKLWNGTITGVVYNHTYTITCSSPFTISGSNTVSWTNTTAAPASTGVTVTIVGASGNGSDIQVSYTEPQGANAKIASYAILVVKSANAGTFDLAAANAVASGNCTATAKGAQPVTLTATTQDVNGDLITRNVAYKVFVLSIADGVNATINALSLPSADVTLPTPITTSNIMATNTFGKIKFDTDTTTTATDLAGKILADGVALTGFAARNSDTTGKLWNGTITGVVYNHTYTITCSSPFTISGSNTVSWTN